MNQLKLTTATLDTNVFPAEDLLARASRQGIAAAAITVSRREAEGSRLEEEISALESIAETGVWGESRWSEAVWASEVDAQCLVGARPNSASHPCRQSTRNHRGTITPMARSSQRSGFEKRCSLRSNIGAA
jgi:hypothetical protein